MLGIINFTHSDPLYQAIEDKSLVVRDTPKKLLEMLLGGKIECAMISLLEYYRHMDSLEIVESATIHSKNTTMSTLLVSKEPGIREPMLIAVTEHTKTTAFYLEMVLKKLGIDYELILSNNRDADSLLDEAEYALVIGDEALKVFRSHYSIIWDVGSQFSSIYSMIPVFSVTVKRKGVDCTEEIKQLDLAIQKYMGLADKCAAEDGEKLGLDPSILRQYFRTIKHDFNSEARRTVGFMESISRSLDDTKEQ